MRDTDIPVSGEPYIKKSKLLALAQEHLFDPLLNLFKKKKKKEEEENEDDIQPLDPFSGQTLDLEMCWDVLQKALDKGLIDEVEFLSARKQYMQIKKAQAVDTLSKAFDENLITEDQYLNALEQAELVV